MSNLVKTLNLFFYSMMSFSGHPVCHIGLIWCILLGNFLCFQTKPLVLVNYRVNLTSFSGCFACIQMLSLQNVFKTFGLFRPIFKCVGVIFDPYNVYSFSCGFCSQISVFSIQIFVTLVKFYKVYRPYLVFKQVSGHRLSPIALKSVQILQNVLFCFSFLANVCFCYQTLLKVLQSCPFQGPGLLFNNTGDIYCVYFYVGGMFVCFALKQGILG